MNLSVPGDIVNVNESVYISFSSATEQTEKKKKSRFIKYFNILLSIKIPTSGIIKEYIGEAAPQICLVIKLFPLPLPATAHLWKWEYRPDKFPFWISKVIIIFFVL